MLPVVMPPAVLFHQPVGPHAPAPSVLAVDGSAKHQFQSTLNLALGPAM